MTASILDLFRAYKKGSIGLVAVFLLANGIVLANACLHDPRTWGKSTTKETAPGATTPIEESPALSN